MTDSEMHDLPGSRKRRRGGARIPGSLAGAVAVLATACLLASPSPASEVAGVAFDPMHRVDGRSLTLSGLGLHRYRLFIKLYAIALYVDPEVGVGDVTPDVVLGDVPKRLELETFWPIRAEIFRRLTRERIEQAVPADRFEQLAPSIEALNALYEDAEKGDRIAITYLPGRGTELARNGVPKGVVEGETFAQAMFGIWLGDRPMDFGLRAKLVENPS